MKTRSNSFLRSALLTAATLALGIVGSAHAENYHYGSAGAENFTINLTGMASVQGAGIAATGTFTSNAFGAVYDRGADQDATYIHFDLSPLEGTTINGEVNLNLTVDAQYGGGLYGGIIGTAAAAWTAAPGAPAPGITPFTPVAAPADGVYTTGQTATWTIGNSTFSGILANLGTFNGLGITAGDTSQAHFTYGATLTGSYNPGEIRVIGGTDWSAATWDNGSKTLTVAGTSDVSGGNVTMVTDTTLSMMDDATLGGGNFSGTFANNGSLILGSSADQTLAGAISGSGSVTVNAGTLNLTKANDNLTTSGGLTINNGGTVVLQNYNPMGNSSVTMPVTINSGGLMTMYSGWSVHLGPLTLNGGDLSSGGFSTSQWGSYYMDGDVTVKPGTSTISALDIISGGLRTFDVETGGTLNVTGGFSSLYTGAFGLLKTGTGTMILSGTNSYVGDTTVDDGTFSLAAEGSLSFRPTINGATNLISGSSTATLSYLGTVNLDLSGADATVGNAWSIVDLASFNGPAPTFNPALVTSTLGDFSEATPGVWELPVIGGKWIFTEATASLSYVFAANDYETWKTANGVIGSENDDDDNDGLTNHEEYAFGLDPTGGSSVNPITSPLDKSNGKFSYTRRALGLPTPALSYTVWYSTDLSTWAQDNGATEGTPSLAGEVETVEVTVSPALLANPKLFIQVRAN